MVATINPDVFTFFKELENNNNREWFEPQKKRFKALEAEVKQLATDLTAQMNEHDSVDKFKLFRLYRDVRFSKDKTPFKTHFGISFHREKPAYRGGYYLHIKPGDNFVATGFWNPQSSLLRTLVCSAYCHHGCHLYGLFYGTGHAQLG